MKDRLLADLYEHMSRIRFSEITIENIDLVRRYMADKDISCEYSAIVAYSWHKRYMAEVCGCLVIKMCVNGEVSFLYPLAGVVGDEKAALEAIEEDCMESDTEYSFFAVSPLKMPVLISRYPHVCIANERLYWDYIYHYADLRDFPGKKYARQRSSVKGFWRDHPDVTFRRVDEADRGSILSFLDQYEQMNKSRKDSHFTDEMKVCRKSLDLLGKSWIYAAAFFDGDRMIAFCMCEACGGSLLIHFEKALSTYKHIYQAFIASYLNDCPFECEWINREDDAGDAGLRISKTRYRPARMGEKYEIMPRNELQVHTPDVPSLTAGELTLDAFTDEDAAAYNAMALDPELNRYWGYDDSQNMNGEYGEMSLLHVIDVDYAKRRAINFAVRLSGELIGEAILYHFDRKGGAEFGIRIMKEYQGRGYSRQIYETVAGWGLYELGLRVVRSKCYHENAASYALFSSAAEEVGKDETFTYFELHS